MADDKHMFEEADPVKAAGMSCDDWQETCAGEDRDERDAFQTGFMAGAMWLLSRYTQAQQKHLEVIVEGMDGLKWKAQRALEKN